MSTGMTTALHSLQNVTRLSASLVFSIFFMSLFSSRGLNLPFIILACMGGWYLRGEIVHRWYSQTPTLWKFWVLFLGFALSSVLWAENPNTVVQQVAKVLGLTLLGWMWAQSSVTRSRAMYRALCWGVVAGFVGLVVDHLILGGAYADYRLVSVAYVHAHIAILMLLCFWCVLPSLQHATFWAFPGSLLLCFIGFLANSDAVKGASLLGLLAFYLTWMWGRRILWGFIPCLVLGVLGGVFWMSEILHHDVVVSWVHYLSPEFGILERLSLYDWASQRFLEKPWLGYGWANTKSVMLQHPVPVLFAELYSNIAAHESVGINVHNIFLQTAVELGGVGLIGLLGGVIVSAHAICTRAQMRLQAAAQMAFLTSVLFVSSVSMTLFSTWWLMAVFFFIPFIEHRKSVI